MIEVKLDETKLTITIPRRSPRPSASGKTTVLGTTRGVKTGNAMYKGQPVCVVASAFVYPKQSQKPKSLHRRSALPTKKEAQAEGGAKAI
jgi:hypothetical protein